MATMKSRKYLTLAALAVSLTGQSAPAEIRLLPAGRFRAADGSGRPAGIADGWMLDAAQAGKLVAAATSRASDYAIDYEHQTLHTEKNGQPAPAAGWFKSLEWREGDGLYAVDVRWTDRAAAMIAAQEYRYLSPVFSYHAKSGAVTGLGPAALTNNPGLDGLTDLAALSAFFHEEKEQPMKQLLAALGLAEDATEDQALAALAALNAGHETNIAALKSAAPDPAKFVPVDTMQALQTEVAALRTLRQAQDDREKEREVDGVVTAALAAGKLLPPQEKWARDLGMKDLAALNQYLETAQPVAALSAMQNGGKPPAGQPADELSDSELAMCRSTGVSPEDFKKTKLGAQA